MELHMPHPHLPHPHLENRKEAFLKAKRKAQGFNDKVAVRITNMVGTMWCAYIFAILTLVSLPEAIHAGIAALISWIAQTFLQLVLLSIIMVGQKVASEKSDKQLEQTYYDAEALLQINDDMHKLVKQNVHLTEQINELLGQNTQLTEQINELICKKGGIANTAKTMAKTAPKTIKTSPKTLAKTSPKAPAKTSPKSSARTTAKRPAKASAKSPRKTAKA